MFHLSSTPIDAAACQARLRDAGSGACVVFEGWVRDHNEGKSVARLEYEAYDTLALSEGARILEEAQQRFGCNQVYCVHRTGLLEIGDKAVWVGVSTAHRGEAFAACRYIIDELKHRVPIWKKEYYHDGDSGWVACEHCQQAPRWTSSEFTYTTPCQHDSHAGHNGHKGHKAPGPAPEAAQPAYRESVDAEAVFARQQALPEIGEAGQAKLRAARVLIVGAGGLGCPAAQYLAGAGVGSLGICEDDQVERSNLPRQPLYPWERLGRPKVFALAEHLESCAPWCDVEAHPCRLTPGNVESVLANYDICLDCTDNFETKFLLNDAALALRRPLIQAAIYQYEGQLMSVRGDLGGPCLRCLWPEPPAPRCVGNCAEAGVLGALPGVLGAMQAMEALKVLLDLPGALHREMLFVDLLGYQFNKVPIAPRSACRCREPRDAQRRYIQNQQPLALSAASLEAELGPDYCLVDMRGAEERARLPFDAPQVLTLPMDCLDATALKALRPGKLVFCCNFGVRSKSLAAWLRENGRTDVYSLQGGIVAWQRGGAAKDRTCRHA